MAGSQARTRPSRPSPASDAAVRRSCRRASHSPTAPATVSARADPGQHPAVPGRGVDAGLPHAAERQQRAEVAPRRVGPCRERGHAERVGGELVPDVEGARQEPGQVEPDTHRQPTGERPQSWPAEQHDQCGEGGQHPSGGAGPGGGCHRQHEQRERARYAVAEPPRDDRDPRQRGVPAQERPVPDRQPFVDEGVPDVEGAGGHPGQRPGLADESDHAEAGTGQHDQEHGLLDQVPGDELGGEGHQGIAGHGAWDRAVQPEPGAFPGLVGHEDHVATQHVAPLHQQRRQYEQGEQRRPGPVDDGARASRAGSAHGVSPEGTPTSTSVTQRVAAASARVRLSPSIGPSSGT